MIELTITQVVRKPSELKRLLDGGEKVRILFKEQKPNGAVKLSALIEKEK